MQGGGWSGLAGFFGYPPAGAGQNPVAKVACFGPDFGPFLGKWLFGRPKEKQASSDAADAGLGVSSDAADAGPGVPASHVAT